MPAVSEKQKRFMDAAAHNPDFASKAGVPQKVAKEYSEASKGLKFGKGSTTRADLQKVNKPKTLQGKSELFSKGGQIMARKEQNITKAKMGPVKEGGIKKHGEHSVQKKGHTKGTNIKMAAMGKPLGMKKGGKAC